MKEEEKKEMPFGVKYRVGNFEYLKITKTLSKKEIAVMRNQMGVPEEVRKSLTRGGLPYIVVNTISGGWSLCFVCGSAMYNFIQYQNGNGETGEKALYNLFLMMYSDTAVLGDNEYWEAKKKALDEFMGRCKSKVNKEDDEKDLQAVKDAESARATILEMSENIKEESHEGK